MRKMVINLARRGDRRNRFLQNQNGKFVVNGYSTPEMFTAVDGQQARFDRPVAGTEFQPRKGWRDPFQYRQITKGEMGCFASHYQIWQECYHSAQPILVFEDDVEINWDLYNEDRLNEIMNFHEKAVSLLLLGYNENEPNKVREMSDLTDCVRPGYPYNAHAYIMTPHFAQVLISSECHKDVIPVDELFAEWNEKGRNVIALKEEWVSQISRKELPSDIEPHSDEDWFIDFKTHAVTVGTDPRRCVPLLASTSFFGFTPKNLGSAITWQGGDMEAGPGGMQKLNLLRKHLTKLKAHDVVLFTDAYDVLYLGNKEVITRRYLDMKVDIVFAAEKVCWPDEEMEIHFQSDISEYKYLNSGVFIGTVRAINQLIGPECPDDYDDQLYLQRRIHNLPINGEEQPRHNLKIALDYEQYMFMTYDKSLQIKRGQLYNPETYCFGSVYHANGGDEAKQQYDWIYKELFEPLQSPLFIPNHGKFELLEKDMLLVDFMTPQQCADLIDIADKNGKWAPLPEDKFPAYEIRMKELGLWNELQKYWEEQVYPVVEKYWWPMAMYGLRDAFVMRYCVETQKNLPMHNDASLVTGSVKLNEDYKGASLNFPRQDINNDDIDVGKMILFPGMVTHGHECTTLTEGVKYSLTMWTSRYDGDVN